MKDEQLVWETITQYLAKESDVFKNPEQITKNLDIRNDLNFDSLQAATMLMDLEDHFKISVDINFGKLKTVGDIYQLVLDAHCSSLVG